MMNLSNVKPATLAPEQRAKWRDALCAQADCDSAERIAAQLWSDAVDAGDFDKARTIAEETATWFTDEGE
jgi:hypothetical protein